MPNNTMVSQVFSTESDVCDCCGGPRDKARVVIGGRHVLAPGTMMLRLVKRACRRADPTLTL
jgi:hypothetical protein